MFDAKALPPNIRAIIFDCDGTLVDTPPVYARAWAAGFRSSGKDMTPDWYLARAGIWTPSRPSRV
jgi:beta-phosphoglucomutase-like phosphatase (HAD superfamily)